MKRIIAFTLTALLICTTLCAEENLFSFSAGLSSGFPVYGKESVASTGTEIEKGNRVILGIMGAVNLNPLPQVSFFLGNDILWDLTWNSSEKSNLSARIKSLSWIRRIKLWSRLHARLQK